MRYSLKFTTLYTPSSVSKLSLTFRNSIFYNSFLKTSTNKKILLKQSYFVLTWLCYIKSFRCKKPSFFIYPPRISRMTLLKSPMAHKTYSQEQFLLKYNRMSVSFFSEMDFVICPSSVYNSLFFAKFILSNAAQPSTNMLLIKKIRISYLSHDNSYFSFYKFNKSVPTLVTCRQL